MIYCWRKLSLLFNVVILQTNKKNLLEMNRCRSIIFPPSTTTALLIYFVVVTRSRIAFIKLYTKAGLTA